MPLSPLPPCPENKSVSNLSAWENSCLNGCKYCYANKTPQKARENYRYHDPASPLLLGHLRPGDSVTQGAQKSFLAKKALPGQLSL
ncbi:MAG: hypothetical protein ACLR6W_07615 [Evtepia sp.]